MLLVIHEKFSLENNPVFGIKIKYVATYNEIQVCVCVYYNLYLLNMDKIYQII